MRAARWGGQPRSTSSSSAWRSTASSRASCEAVSHSNPATRSPASSCGVRVGHRFTAGSRRRGRPPRTARARRPRLSTPSGGAHSCSAGEREELVLTIRTAVSVGAVKASSTRPEPSLEVARPDAESRAWVTALQTSGQRRDEAVGRLHELLLRAARFEVNRRRVTQQHLRGDDFDDLARQNADHALVAGLSKLDSYRGDSKFTTWAYKFALLEAAVKLRRRAWQGRELPLQPEAWSLFPTGRPSPEAGAEQSELFDELQNAISNELTPHMREVLVATALNGVPLDGLAERLHTTPGALYKTLHDARQKLRAHLAARGMSIGEEEKEEA